MFIGHLGVAFAAKRATPSTSLATLVAAASCVDLLWPVFLLLGWESVRIIPGTTRVTPLEFVSYPISHSLLADIGWGLLFGGVYGLVRQSRRGGVVLGLLVVSHWVLDAVVHGPDLPWYPGGSARAGLGLWSSLVGTVLVEGMLFTVGVWLYLTGTQPADRTGRFATWGVIGVPVLSYIAILVSPPPPSVPVIAYTDLVGSAMLLVLAWWADRHRTVQRSISISI